MLHCVEKQVFGPQKYLSSQKKERAKLKTERALNSGDHC
jgi:hypothetical protein